MSEPLGWGIVGPGEIARVFARSITEADVGYVVGATGGRPGRAAILCADFGAQVYRDVEAMARSPQVEAVYVASPHVFHHEAVATALHVGVPVLCEKPLTATHENTLELIELSRGLGVPLVEGWMYRAHPQIQQLCYLIQKGQIGRPLKVTSHFGFAFPYDPKHRLYSAELGGGGILDVGGYPLSLAMLVAAVAGYDIDDTQLVESSGSLAPSGVDQDASARFLIGQLELDVELSLTRDLGRAARVFGETGSLELSDPFLPGGERHGCKGELTILDSKGEEWVETIESKHDCFALEALELTRLFREGGGVEPSPPMVGHWESVWIAKQLDLWRKGLGIHF